MAQLALFPDQSTGPAGLRYEPEFVPETAERELICGIAALPLQPFQFGAFEGKDGSLHSVSATTTRSSAEFRKPIPFLAG